MKKLNYILPVILIIGTIIRFWNIEGVPPGLHGDEADTGYSAYSILKTGLSQYGEFNPLAIQEFTGGTHPPLYTYTLIPLIAIFGLNIWVERLPSVIFGILTIVLVYLLVLKLFKNKNTALTASFLTAVNPWAIHISRQGLLEAITLFIVLLGIVLFLYALENPKYYLWSGLAFGLSLFSYDAPKIFLPPFLVLILLIFRKEVFKKKNRKQLIIFSLVIAFFYALMLKVIILDGQYRDYQQVSVFDFNRIGSWVDVERTQTNAPLWLSRIFHNKITVAFNDFLTSYSVVFSLNWLFINGHGNLQQAVSRMGQYYIFSLPFFFLGIYQYLNKARQKSLFLLAWFFLGALPGGLTSGNYAYRSVLLLPVPIVLIALGINYFWEYLKKFKPKLQIAAKTALIGIMLVYIFSYLTTYFLDYPVYASEGWSKEQNDALKYIIAKKDQYEKVFIGFSWGNTYAFLTKLDPLKFQEAYKNKEQYKDIEVTKIDNVYFGSFGPAIKNLATPSAFFPKNSLVIVSGIRFPNLEPEKKYFDPGGVRILYKIFSIK